MKIEILFIFGSSYIPLSEVNATVLHSLITYGLGIGAMGVGFEVLKALTWEKKRKQRKKYYSQEYLLSDGWKRKRYVVLKRDN